MDVGGCSATPAREYTPFRKPPYGPAQEHPPICRPLPTPWLLSRALACLRQFPSPVFFKLWYYPSRTHFTLQQIPCAQRAQDSGLKGLGGPGDPRIKDYIPNPSTIHKQSVKIVAGSAPEGILEASRFQAGRRPSARDGKWEPFGCLWVFLVGILNPAKPQGDAKVVKFGTRS